MKIKDIINENCTVDEASYEGNLGFAEIMQFMKKASPKQKAAFNNAKEHGQNKIAWKIVQDTLGVRLKGKQFNEEEINEIIRKVDDNKWRLYSKKGKNLGTFNSRSGAEKHEQEVQYFKHKDQK